MTEVEKRHSKLVHEMSMLNFDEHLDNEAMYKLEVEASKLENQRYGWYVQIDYKDARYKISKEAGYLTSDKTLCIGDNKTYFESYEEAKEYLDKADIDMDNYIFTFRKSRLIVEVRRPDRSVYCQEIQFVRDIETSISNFESYLGRGYKVVGWRKE